MKLKGIFFKLLGVVFFVLLRKNDMCARSWGFVIRLVIS